MALETAEINQIPIVASTVTGADKFEGEQGGESVQIYLSTLANFISIASSVTAMVNIAIPIGAGAEWYSATAPTNWILAQGQAIYRSTYSALFAVIGTTWGVGDGSNTFNLPDKREVVGIGIGTNATVVMSVHDVYTLAGFKDDQINTHIHNITTSLTSYVSAGGGVFTGGASGSTKDSVNTNGPIANGADSVRTGAVTRGKRIGVNWIIKYQ